MRPPSQASFARSLAGARSLAKLAGVVQIKVPRPLSEQCPANPEIVSHLFPIPGKNPENSPPSKSFLGAKFPDPHNGSCDNFVLPGQMHPSAKPFLHSDSRKAPYGVPQVLGFTSMDQKRWKRFPRIPPPRSRHFSSRTVGPRPSRRTVGPRPSRRTIVSQLFVARVSGAVEPI